MSVPRLLDPIALAEKGPNNVRTLALGYFGEVARALANDYQLTLIPPDTLGMDSLLEWRDAIAEEVLLLAQMDRDRASEISKPLARSRPFRHGPELASLVELDAAAVVVPVDTGDPSKQGAWMHLWLVHDPHQRLVNDDRALLEDAEGGHARQQSRLFVVTGGDVSRKFSGRSWQLGHSLAERALRSEYKVDLAAKWIVSGEVNEERIFPVRVGNKTNIPWKGTKRNWLLPSANMQSPWGAESEVGSEFRKEALGRLFQAATVKAAWSQITGEEEAEVIWTKGSPFPGLVPYDVSIEQGGELEADYSKVFFGRKETIQKCRRMLAGVAKGGCAFLLIAGDSGSGKSSLARAGLVPEIARPGTRHGIDTWRSAVFRPSTEPLTELSKVLFAAVPELSRNGITDAGQWARTIAENPESAATLLRQVLAGATCLLLVVDQLEDIFDESFELGTSVQDFAAALAACARSGAVWLVATLRADKLDALIRNETLRKLKEDGATYDVAPPDFTEIVRRPVNVAGLSFEMRGDGIDLGDELLTDLQAGGSDALPLLQMTLKQLFEARELETNTLTFNAYEKKIGRLEGAIGNHADAVLNGLAESSRKEIASLLLALTRRDPGGLHLARPSSRAAFETTPARHALVKQLLEARLLVVGKREELRVAHEALFRRWKAATEILREHDLLLSVRDKLEPWVREWATAAMRADHLLPRNLLLANAETVLDQLRELTGSGEMVKFVEASIRKNSDELMALRERVARDAQKVAGHMEDLEFSDAANELDRMADYLKQETHPDLVRQSDEVEERRQRVHRLAKFYTASLEAETFAGEEDFTSAYRRCQDALQALGNEREPWGQFKGELKELQIERLQRTAYRLRLLFSALQLVPGIVVLFPRSAPGPPGPNSLFNVKKLVESLSRFLVRQDNPEALAEFRKCFEALSHVRELEQQYATDHDEQWLQSRTSFLVEQIAKVLHEYADGPKGKPINYRRLLPNEARNGRPDPVNAVDYFFIGLFNYFISKRGEGLLAKILSASGRFPDLDGRSPLKAAERLLRAAIALEPEHFWPHWLLGRTLLAGKKYDSAELAFNAAIGLQPEYARGYEQRALALGYQWVQTRDRRLQGRALTDSENAREVARGDPSIFWPRGELLQLLGDREGALASFSCWLELEENIPALISRVTGVATLYALAGKLLKRTPGTHASIRALRADAKALLALVYLTWAGWDDAPTTDKSRVQQANALATADEVLQVKPNHLHALTAKGVVLRQRGEFQAAITILGQALKEDEFAYRAVLNRALAYERIGATEAATTAWKDLAAKSARARTMRREMCPEWMLSRGCGAREASVGNPNDMNLVASSYRSRSDDGTLLIVGR